mmetsp:Transcript_28062/g.43657  ORF Transcript_28062/g.43657 Transcript_28062/m.43657 type:complete len:897 (+) Transcript_28062:3-2693(+)
MKFNYQLSKVCGTSYASSGSKSGSNILFSPSLTHNNQLFSPAGNRIHAFDLSNNGMRTLPIECRSNVACMAISKKGLLLAIDVENYAVLMQLHESTAVELHRFHFKRKVRCVEFNDATTRGGAQYFAVGYGKLVQVWRVRIEESVMPFELHRTMSGFAADVTSLQWSPDSTLILAGARDNTSRLYSLHRIEGFTPYSFAGHKAPVIGAYFGADDGRIIHTVSADGACFTWTFSKDGFDSVDAEKSVSNALDFFTGGSLSLPQSGVTPESSQSRKMDQAHSILNGRWRRSRKHYFNQQGTEVTCTAMNLSGLLVVGFSSGIFALYEMPSCTNVHTLSISNRRIHSVALNATGEWLAFGCPELGQLLVWEWQSETYVLKQQGHSYAMRQMAYSPDGSQFVVTGGEDGKVKMWNTDTGFCFVTFAEHTAPITALAFANPKVVLSASLDGTVRAHDLVRYRNFRTLTTPSPVQFCSMATDASGEIVCAGTLETFEIYVWSLQTGKVLEVLTGHRGPISELSFNPEQGKLASASWDGTTKVWDVFKKNTPQENLEHNADVVCLAFRPDGKILCTGTTRGQLVFWDVEDGTVVHTIDGRKDIRGGRKVNDLMAAENNVASRYFTSVCFSADGSCVIAGGNSKYVCIYEVSHQILLRKFQLSHNRSLDGVLDELNSKNMGDGGPVDRLDDSGDEAEFNIRLPGAKRNDDGSRRSKMEILSTRVAFSTTGREWATVSNEGLHIYSLDEDCLFDPIALTDAVTPSEIHMCLRLKLFAKALLMSMHLNEVSLVQLVVESTPLSSVPLVVKSITPIHLDRLLHYISNFMAESPHIEYYLEWCLQLLQTHGKYLQKNHRKFMRAFRAMHRTVRTRHDELRVLCDENKYNLDYMEEQAQLIIGHDHEAS